MWKGVSWKKDVKTCRERLIAGPMSWEDEARW